LTNLMLERNADRDTFVVADHPPYSNYRAWSEREYRWVSLTFDEYLNRPGNPGGSFP